MSKRRSRKNAEETPEVVGGGELEDEGVVEEAAGDDESREEAVEELDEALEALSEGDAASGEEIEPENPLARVDVSGETSFGSVEFEEEDEEADAEDEDEDEDDGGDVTDDEASDDEKDEDEVVIHDADAEDRAEEFERMRAELTASQPSESMDDEVAPGGQPRDLAELVSICEALIFVSEDPLPVKAIADILKEDKGW